MKKLDKYQKFLDYIVPKNISFLGFIIFYFIYALAHDLQLSYVEKFAASCVCVIFFYYLLWCICFLIYLLCRAYQKHKVKKEVNDENK